MNVFDIPDSFSDIKNELILCLKTVMDPELNVNIVDLGLVYGLKLDQYQRVISVEMTLSSKFCPMGESILAATENCIERTFTNFQAEVDLVWEPEWNYTFISPDGLRRLGG